MNFQHVKIMKQVVVHTVGGHSSGGRGKRGGWPNRRGTFRSRQWRDGSRSSVPAISGAITDVVPIPISPPNEVNQVENEKINSDFTAQDVDQSECQTPPHIADEPNVVLLQPDVDVNGPDVVVHGPDISQDETVKEVEQRSHQPPLNALELAKKRDGENADAAIKAQIRRLQNELKKSQQIQEQLQKQLEEQQQKKERKAERKRLREAATKQVDEQEKENTEPLKKDVVTISEAIKKKFKK
uniref:Casein kinase substrate, phosphoprotein PP28 n=1 Tax=Bursaphelenchus xylophilus TaxID=6326 RepID=A0A1I7SJJ8_BURXY